MCLILYIPFRSQLNVFVIRPSRVQSSPGHRSRSSNETATPAPQRPVTAAALPSGGSNASDGSATTASSVARSDSKNDEGPVQLQVLQNILSGMGGAGGGG